MTVNLMDANNARYEDIVLRQFFLSAEEALLWAAELLRKRRLPKLAAFWQSVSAEADEVAAAWAVPERLFILPQSYDDRLSLALQVEQALTALERQNPAQAQILRWWAWGDWADDDRLRRALAFQEHCRQQGMRVRIAYRYSYAQLGLLLRCDKKTAWRKVQDALAALQDHMNIPTNREVQAAA